MRIRSRFRRALGAIGVALAASCAESTAPSGNPRPTISAVTPSSIPLGATGATVTISGSGFVPESKVHIRLTERATTYVSATRLTASLEPADAATVGTISVEVVNPEPGGGRSPFRTITVRDVLTVGPDVVALDRGASQTFTAIGVSGDAAAVTWRVNGVPGGSSSVGFITAGGSYTAPSVMPADSVVISAALNADPTIVRHAAAFIVPPASFNNFRITIPRAVDGLSPTDTRLLIRPNPSAASVRFALPSGAPVEVRFIGAGIYTAIITSGTAFANARAGALHNHIGFVDEYDAGGTRTQRLNVFANLRDAGMPNVPITPIGADAQRSPHLLNLRLDSATAYPSQAIVSRALQTLGNPAVDFVAVISSVTSVNNRVYLSVRNDVEGIGLSLFDQSAFWGGSPRLQGVIAFPVDYFFDGAERAMCHEIGHRWINFASQEPLLSGRPHWRPSSMATGVMGFSIPGSGAGGTFQWRLEPVDATSVRAESATSVEAQTFDALDLYLMGLLPPDSVPTRYLLPAGQSPNTMSAGLVYPATPYTVAEYIAQHGVRVPASGTSQREFVVATVILSVGRLLSPAEMAFFDHAAARLETRVTVPAQSGFVSDDAVGCYQATGGRATFSATLP